MPGTFINFYKHRTHYKYLKMYLYYMYLKCICMDYCELLGTYSIKT